MTVLDEVKAERARQDAKWGRQDHENGTALKGDHDLCIGLRARCDERFAAGVGTWRDILEEEVAEAFAEESPTALRVELIQVAAVCVAWAEAIDRKGAK